MNASSRPKLSLSLGLKQKQPQQEGIGPSLMLNRSNSSFQAPGGDYDDDGNSESDRESDDKMLRILLRIKQTKEALEESRIKKGAFLAVKEAESKLQKEIKSDIMRFHGKWTKKIRGVVVQIQSLKLKSQDIEERNSALRRQRKLDVNQKEKEMRIISDQLQSIAEQFKMTGNTQDAFVADEIDAVKRDIHANICELDLMVKKMEREEESGGGGGGNDVYALMKQMALANGGF